MRSAENDVAYTSIFKMCDSLLPINRAGPTEKRFDLTHTTSFDSMKETGLMMTENNPKIEVKLTFPPSSGRNAGPAKGSRVGLVENHTTTHAAKYQKSVDAMPNHIQKDYTYKRGSSHHRHTLSTRLLAVGRQSTAPPLPPGGLIHGRSGRRRCQRHHCHCHHRRRLPCHHRPPCHRRRCRPPCRRCRCRRRHWDWEAPRLTTTTDED